MSYADRILERAEEKADDLFRQDDVIDLARSIRDGDLDAANRALDAMMRINVNLVEWVAQGRASC